MQKKEHITIEQIALESDVSIATVSRVINNTAPVSAKTKERVEQIIKKYNFTPNALARGLICKETKTLGVILPDISNPFFSSMFLEIERDALEAGYSIFLCNTLYGGSSHGIINTLKESFFFDLMIDKHVDGVLVIGGQVDMVSPEDDYCQALKRLRQHLPVVVIGKEIPDTGCTFIQNETGYGITAAVNYLHMLGHSRIAFVGGQTGVTITEIRLNAYRQALSNIQIPADNGLIALSDYYIDAGYDAVNRLLDNHINFSSFIAINDNVALGGIRALADYGLRVPNDIAVISCDQFPTAAYQTPRLTSVNQHHEKLARLVVHTLLHDIRGTENPVPLSILPELVIRESCGTALNMCNAEIH